MKKRKWLVSLLAVVLTVTMLPIAAFAQTAERTTGLDLSNKTEAEANEAEGWSWSPDGEGGYTLVLENVNISAQSGDAITLPNNVDVDIILKGNNRISGETALFGVETAGGLVTIKGETSDASLTAVSNENSMWGTISISNLLIESGNVYTEGDGQEFLFANTEDMKTKEPDVILRAAHGLPDEARKMFAEEFSTNDIWQHFKAVQEGRVYDLDSNLFNMSANFSYEEALKALQPMLYGEE